MLHRKRKSTAWAMMLALALVIALLGGCTGSKENAGNNSSPTTTPPKAETTGTPAPAVETQKPLDPVTLTWYFRNSEPNNAAAVLKKANEIIQSAINATLDFKFINPGDYDTKMQLAMSSGEKYDIAFTSSWANNYLNNVSKGAYLPLDDLLTQYPDLQNLFQQQVWDAVKVGGKIYGVPNNQIMADQPGLWFKKDLVEKYKLDVASIDSLAKLTDALQTVKTGEPDMAAIFKGIPGTAFRDFTPMVEDFYIDTKDWTVHDQQAALLDNYKVMRDWYQRGFFPQDIATLKDDLPLMKSGKVFSRYNRQNPAAQKSIETNYGFEIVNLATGPAVIARGAVQSTLNAISVTSPNPERAMMLINLINTNKELFNLLKFGIEGQDYKKLSDNVIEPIKDGFSLPGWMLGNEFNSYLLASQPADVWEQTKILNDTATVDPLIGFSFDRTNVENEIAQLGAITTEYVNTILVNGLADVDTTFQAMQDKRKAAGMDKVMAEIQKQLDAWRAAQ